MSVGISLILVVFFLAMNAFFVIAEFALVRVRKSQLELAVEEGKPGAKAAMEIALNVNKYLSACQLGITLASLALGWLGEPAFSSPDLRVLWLARHGCHRYFGGYWLLHHDHAACGDGRAHS